MKNDIRFMNRVLFDHAMNDWRDVIQHKITMPAAVFSGEGSGNLSAQRWIHEAVPSSALFVYSKSEYRDHELMSKNPVKFAVDPISRAMTSHHSMQSTAATQALRLAQVATTALLLVVAAVSVASAQAPAQRPVALRFPLASATGLRPHNVTATAVMYAGKRGVRLIVSDEVRRRVVPLPLDQQAQLETFALLDGADFSNGVIEAEIAGVPAPDAPGGARGFVGIAFRLQPDLKTYDAFYLRPTNGRADDQERRNHSAQYISHPDWTWDRLRRETPSRYESYVDLVPGAWTKIRIEVRGDSARLFVHGQPQPTLFVNDVKTGTAARGAVALWINPGTVAHFRNVHVAPAR